VPDTDTTEVLTEEDLIDACPSWCEGPGDQDICESHYSEIHTITLELEAPSTREHPLCRVPSTSAKKVEVYLEGRPGAVWPIVRIGREGGGETDVMKLSPLEAIELHEVLTLFIDEIRTAHKAAAHAVASGGEVV
jgi:hypothetical protein